MNANKVAGIEGGGQSYETACAGGCASQSSNVNRELGDPLNRWLTLLWRELGNYLASRAKLDEPASNQCCQELAPRSDLRQLVEALVNAKQADGLSARYIETLRSHLRRFAMAVDCDIELIKVSQIENWLRSLPTGARARNNMRGSIITLFHFARKQGYLPKGVPTEADEITRAKDFGGKIGVLSPSEFAPVITCAPAKVQLFLAIGAFAGLRSSEILRLNWSEVNLERRLITVAPEKSKTATRRLVPIQPSLLEWLIPHHGDSGLIFTRRRDADGAIRFAKMCGLEWPNNALRHSYGTYRLAITADAARVALEMGNSPQKLIRHYRELADESEAAAWFAIYPPA